MEKDEFIQEKSKWVAECILHGAKAVQKNTRIGYPPKRIFRVKDRRPLVRIRKQAARAGIAIGTMVTAMQVLMLISQPRPRLKSGTYAKAGEDILPECIYRGKNPVYVTKQD